MKTPGRRMTSLQAVICEHVAQNVDTLSHFTCGYSQVVQGKSCTRIGWSYYKSFTRPGHITGRLRIGHRATPSGYYFTAKTKYGKVAKLISYHELAPPTMVTESLVYRWWTSVSRVTSRPAVLLSVSVIGCLMLWLASKQVKSTVQVLADLQLLGPGQVDRLPDRPRYCLFGFLALLFVWLDLFLFKKLFQSVATVVTWSKNRLRAKEDADTCTNVSPKQKAMKPVRKNPVRACRSAGRRLWGFDD
ncbi:hypothetical protein RRG08_028764 [Elysia crispata]|uniref:Uncharacterized protein n=1 Tax=Elysia crispata TaxID=231223 RepID=A0AAE1DII5_9GAST|nr:hypothetical protein RRG08_028764 [Elysia crispata]